jgi:hypothetical protein
VKQLQPKILGRIQVFEGVKRENELRKFATRATKAFSARICVIRIEAFDWHRQHILPVYTEEVSRKLTPAKAKRMSQSR